MIDRIARALESARDDDGDPLSWSPGHFWTRSAAAKALARAALEAMREPTFEMALAGGGHLPNCEDATPSELAEDANRVWAAMIEEALEVEDPEEHQLAQVGRNPEGEDPLGAS